MLNNENNSNVVLDNPREFYNNQNILSEDLISEHEEIDNNNLYIIRTVKITYENGENVIVTKKIVCDTNDDSTMN